MREEQVQAWESSLLRESGKLAQALPLAEAANRAEPTNRDWANELAWQYHLLNEFERMLAVESSWSAPRVVALLNLGRFEEAHMLVGDTAMAHPLNMITFFWCTGQWEALIQYIEERWESLEALQSDFGSWAVLNMAKAYLETGNPEKLDQAMAIVRKALDREREQGADDSGFWIGEAAYWTLSGEPEQAIDFIERALADNGYFYNTGQTTKWDLLKPLEGHPRYEAVQRQALTHLNRERAELGLEPLDPVYPHR
jgi:tetratricopeptide (TPR) repeat protein